MDRKEVTRKRILHCDEEDLYPQHCLQHVQYGTGIIHNVFLHTENEGGKKRDSWQKYKIIVQNS
jgi:hypothetical protein